MVIKFGPAGLGPVKESVQRLEEYREVGLRACEIAFTYGIYIKNEKDVEEIAKNAKKLGIELSIHAPYWLNLNSSEKRKIEESKKRIIECCKIGEKLNAEVVVFHPGFYGKMDKQKSYENIKKVILEIISEIKRNKWKIKIAPETMGKVNVFGSLDEISKLVEETDCGFCLDFAHILARYKKIDFDTIKEKFNKYKKWHCHFSGIVYGEKGERRHIKTSTENWKNLLKNLPRDKDITIINESPDMIEDSIEGLKIYNRLY